MPPKGRRPGPKTGGNPRPVPKPSPNRPPPSWAPTQAGMYVPKLPPELEVHFGDDTTMNEHMAFCTFQNSDLVKRVAFIRAILAGHFTLTTAKAPGKKAKRVAVSEAMPHESYHVRVCFQKPDVNTDPIAQAACESMMSEGTCVRPSTMRQGPANAAPGELMVVEEDFTFYDRASLAADLFVWTVGWEDPEERNVKGGILYLATVHHTQFWSMMLNYLQTGQCLPMVENPTDTKSPMIFPTRESQQMFQCNPIQASRSLFMRPKQFPAPTLVKSRAESPMWYTALDEFWTTQLQDMHAGGNGPCTYAAKGICHIKFLSELPQAQPEFPRCDREHDRFAEAVSKLQGKLKGASLQTLSMTEAKIAAQNLKPANATHCCAADGCGKMDGTPSVFKRCSRCKNVYYCTPACQKKHWATHKLNCRVSGLDAKKPHSSVWAVVVPADLAREPYCVLIREERGLPREADCRRAMGAPAFDREEIQKKFMQAMVAQPTSAPPKTLTAYSNSFLDLNPIGDKGIPDVSSSDIGLMCDWGSTTKPVNARACALMTDGNGPTSTFAVRGANVKVRGDALLLRLWSEELPDDQTQSTDEHIRDFTMPDYTNMFGLFTMTPVIPNAAGEKKDKAGEGAVGSVPAHSRTATTEPVVKSKSKSADDDDEEDWADVSPTDETAEKTSSTKKSSEKTATDAFGGAAECSAFIVPKTDKYEAIIAAPQTGFDVAMTAFGNPEMVVNTLPQPDSEESK